MMMIHSTIKSVLLATLLGVSALLAPPDALAQAAAGKASAAPRVLLETSEGNITLELNPDKAPQTVANFLAYVNDGFYSGTVFHRVIDGFMIQGGGMTADLKQKPTRAPIALENRGGLKNDRGTIAMARTGDPNSATAQFFINVVDNGRLDYPNPDGYGYAVFGKVVDGMSVVDKIKGVPTASTGGNQNVPATAILIRSAKVLK
jgi:peptidyl-prolyl cis-trans isomerase A (cyclophilin A)